MKPVKKNEIKSQKTHLKKRLEPNQTKKMKNTYKLLSGLILLTITLHSCSTENQETSELNALEAELKLEHAGILEIESSTYIFKNAGETVKFENKNRAFEFSFSDETKFTIERSESKHEGGEATVINPGTGEFIKFSGFHELKNNRVQFDLELSNGQTFDGVTYKFDKSLLDESKWHDMLAIAVSSSVIQATLQHGENGLSSACKAAITSCAKSGGKPVVTFDTTGGWFTAKSCSVACN